jgi:hypothetical protein
MKKLLASFTFMALAASVANAATITFESPYTTGAIGATNGSITNAPFTGQQGWSLSTSNGTGLIITTTTSGEYVGGQALSASTTAADRTYIGGKLGIVNTAATNTITFDLRFQSNMVVTAGFLGDGDTDGRFDQNLDTGMQFGVLNNSVHVRNALFGTNTTLTGITGGLSAGSWYRFNIIIGEVVGTNRSITMSVRDLTAGSTIDLNGASAGTDYSFSAAVSAFGVAPEDAVGGFVRVTQLNNGSDRSAIDNLSFTAIPEPSTALLGALGLLALLRRRRRA